MIIRKADISDEMSVYDLSNDAAVRNASFNNNIILYEEHKEWFRKQLEDDSVLFLVFYEENELAGQVRFRIQKNYAVVSLSLSKQFRGRGFGKIMMKHAIEILKMSYPDVEKINAYVKKENKTSAVFFEKCNYVFTQELSMNGQDSYLFDYIVQVS